MTLHTPAHSRGAVIRSWSAACVSTAVLLTGCSGDSGASSSCAKTITYDDQLYYGLSVDKQLTGKEIRGLGYFSDCDDGDNGSLPVQDPSPVRAIDGIDPADVVIVEAYPDLVFINEDVFSNMGK